MVLGNRELRRKKLEAKADKAAAEGKTDKAIRLRVRAMGGKPAI